jgi:anthranilate phosphoribosyltransferase
VIYPISKLVKGQDLSEPEAGQAMKLILAGDATPSQIAGFAIALRIKGETAEEIAGLARTARAHAVPLSAGRSGLVDTCGTGGDSLGTFNISTLAAIVAAACGAPVAKHGNRAASSQCGSADVLEELGVKIDLGPEGALRCLDEAGIAFLFAPVYHSGFRFATVPRRELGVRTFFNVLGPLCNPAGARRQALGVADESLAERMAEVLERLGVEHALVFHGGDGMDELTTTGPSRVIEVGAAKRRRYVLEPAELGFPKATLEALRGGGPADNAAIARQVLGGASGPRRDVVLLNSSAALIAAGLAKDFKEGIGLAAEALDSGRAGEVLDRWAKVSQAVPASGG